MSTTLSPSYTAEDLLSMPDGENYELVDGQLVERAMGTESSWIAGHLLLLLGEFLRHNDSGWLLPPDASFQCFSDQPNRVRKPDVSFIRRGRLPNEELPRGHCRIAPDIVAEVVSPNDLYSNVIRKVLEFQEAGVPLVWVIEPDSWSVMIYRQDGPPALLREEDNLSGEEVLAGFSCRVADLFPPRRQTQPATDAEINSRDS